MKYYLEDIKNVLTDLSSSERGLSSAEARHRLEKYGYGRISEAKRKNVILLFLSQLADPTVIVLLCAAAISAVSAYFSGEKLFDVFIILFVVIMNAIFGTAQEYKAERAIEKLKLSVKSHTLALRNGEFIKIPSDEAVIGDIVKISAGENIPADCRIISSSSFKADESALTGESVAAEKDEKTILSVSDIPLGDRKNCVYMGSTAVYGSCRAIVYATGMNTEMGKIASAVANGARGQTPLQKQLAKLSKLLTIAVLAICLFIFLFLIIKSRDRNTRNLLECFMMAVSLAVAAIPEGLTAVVTVVLSLGVTKMSQRHAIIRRLTAVEALGCTQVICTDKTGTLTKNKMTVTESVTGDRKLAATAFALCSDVTVTENTGDFKIDGDPTECGSVSYALSLGANKNALERQFPKIAEIPFDSERKLMTTLHKKGSRILQFTVGAPDALIARCEYLRKDGKNIKMTDGMRKSCLDENHVLAEKGLRVLAAGGRERGAFPDISDTQSVENGLTLYGIVGMSDPIRDEVPSEVEKCTSAGIKTVMITGDHLDTAIAIGKSIGIIGSDTADIAISGAELDCMSDTELANKIESIRIYARVRPEHKTRIVSAWKKKGYVTAMTGDGINDAPSLKIADIGIGMGISGTDVAKNVSDMVLADDNFATVTYAVEEGRRIYESICKAVRFLLSSNLAEVLTVFTATVCGFTVLEPIHILWINLMTDSIPALALGLEPAEATLMRSRPRNSHDTVFSNGVWREILFQGTVVAALAIFSYFVGVFIEFGTLAVRQSGVGVTTAFLTLSGAEIFHSWNMRSRTASVLFMKKRNPILFLSILLSLSLSAVLIFVSRIRGFFGFSQIDIRLFAVATAISAAIVPIVETEKAIRRIIGKIRRKKCPAN